MKQKVVIIGHGYTSRLSLIRSLGPLGYDVTVVVMVFHDYLGRLLRFDGGKPIDCHSKYVNRVLYCYAKGEDALIKLLLDRCSDSRQKVIVIPDSDFSAFVIDRNQERLKNNFIFPHINYTPGAVGHFDGVQATVGQFLWDVHQDSRGTAFYAGEQQYYHRPAAFYHRP